MASSMEKFRTGGVSGLRGSVDLTRVAKVAESEDIDGRAREACLTLAAQKTFLGPAECLRCSEALGFDSRRLCVAHNIVVASKYADSVHLSTLLKLLEGLLDSPDELEGLLVDLIALPQPELSGALIDEVAGIVRFRPHALRNREWAESVYRSL